MRDSKTLRAALGFVLWLIFTATPAARADSSRSTGSRRGDAFAVIAPHDTWGPSVRVGTVVGTVDAAAVSATGLGLMAAAGYRFGRLALESELMVMSLQEQGPSSLSLGRAERFGMIVRYDVVRTHSQIVGPHTLLTLYVEAGASQSWAQWFEPAAKELPRIVPRDTRRIEGQAGFGVSIDHRFDRHSSYPSRLAWQLGWRLAAPSLEEPGYACRGSCRLSQPVMETETLEGSVLFQSSLMLSW